MLNVFIPKVEGYFPARKKNTNFHFPYTNNSLSKAIVQSIKYVMKCALFTYIESAFTSDFVTLQRFTFLCIPLTPWWFSFFHHVLLSKTTPSANLLKKISILTKRRAKWKISDKSLSLPFYWQPICLLLDLHPRGFWSCQHILESRWNREKDRRGYLSRWRALMLAQNQIQILNQCA